MFSSKEGTLILGKRILGASDLLSLGLLSTSCSSHSTFKSTLKGRYREIFSQFFLHILVDIGPQKTTLKGYFPKPFIPRDMGCLKSIF